MIIAGNVDLDYFYGDTAQPESPKKSVDEVAQDVVNGKYGNGADRKAALEAAGYNYDEVQANYYKCWGEVMEKIGADKTPHEARHTFETLLDNAKGNRKSSMVLGVTVRTERTALNRRVMITPQFRTRSMNFAEHLRNPLMKLQGQSSVVSMETVLIVRTESPQKVMIMQQYRQGSMP